MNMFNIKNLIVVILFLIFTGCGSSGNTEIQQTNLSTNETLPSSGTANEVITHNGTSYKTVTSPYTGKVWLDRNLGARRVCIAYDDSDCYGDYYQWGRDADGHEKSNSTTTTTQATNINNAGSKFIDSRNDKNYDWVKDADLDGSLRSWNWSKTDGSSICPVGYRVPTIAELRVETKDEGVKNNGDAFYNFLKLPSSGGRTYGAGPVYHQGANGSVWSSSASGSNSDYLVFNSSSANIYSRYRAYGMSVRCVKD